MQTVCSVHDGVPADICVWAPFSRAQEDDACSQVVLCGATRGVVELLAHGTQEAQVSTVMSNGHQHATADE